MLQISPLRTPKSLEGGQRQSPRAAAGSAGGEALRQQALDLSSTTRPPRPRSGEAARPPRPAVGRVSTEGRKDRGPDQVARLEGQVAALERALSKAEAKAEVEQSAYFAALQGRVRQVGEEMGVPDSAMQQVHFLVGEAARRLSGAHSDACEEGDPGGVEDGKGDPYLLRSRLRPESRCGEGEGGVGRGTPAAKRVLRDLGTHNCSEAVGRQPRATTPSLMKQVRGGR